MTPEEWRIKHKRCKFCRFGLSPRALGISPPPDNDFWICQAKGKVVHSELPRLFCRVFAVKEDE